jgi:hypothetical protein
MEWALSLLLNNPQALMKAQIEIDTIIGQASSLKNQTFSSFPISKASSTRLSECTLPPHESSEECTVGGFRVPRGTMLLVNMRSVHNDPNLWEEPTKFKPERFHGPEGKRDGFIYLPFGAGRRGCPGEGLATRIIGLALGSLIQCFEWERVCGELVDMSEGTGLTMPKAQNLWAKCRPRPAMVNQLSQT